MYNIPSNVLVRVKDNAPYHRGKIGKFKFMGGPEFDSAVICTSRTEYGSWVEETIICVAPEHVTVLQ